MVKAEQIENLLEFTIIFLSGDLNLRTESFDYYREKYDKYIGFQMKHSNDESDTYKEWKKIWGEDKDINSIINYLLDIIEVYRKVYRDNENNYDKHWLIEIHPEELKTSFEKYIGSIEQINTIRYKNMHPLLNKSIYNKWIERNLRYFKLLRILKNTKSTKDEKGNRI